MPLGRSTPTLEARATLLAATLERRMERLQSELTQPRPPFSVKKPLQAQIRTYLDQRNSGALAALRERNGGPYTDEQVNEYVGTMERELAKHAPEMLLAQHRLPGQNVGTPLDLHPGLLVATGHPEAADPALAQQRAQEDTGAPA